MPKTYKSICKQVLLDPRCWVLIFFLVRLFGITDAPLEIGHSWRQSLTNMIARNFLEVDANILLPRIDMAGNKTGILGSEFPLLNYLIYLVSEVFGYAHWYGRLINLIISSLGVFYFQKIIQILFDKKVAFNATLILLASIWFAFSRKIMPDTFSVSLVIIGLYYGIGYLRFGGWYRLLPFFLLTALGFLCKIPALSLFGVLVVVPFLKELPKNRRFYFVVTAILSVGVSFIWYFLWVPHLLVTYDFELYFPKSLPEGFLEVLPLWREALHKFYFSGLHSYIGFAFALFGVYHFIKNKNSKYSYALLSVTIIFIIFVFKTGAVFPTHNYYIIPFVPFLAILSAYGIAQLKLKRVAFVLLFLIVSEGILNQFPDFFILERNEYKLSLESTLDENIPGKELVVVNGERSPQFMYFAHRKGWSLGNAEIRNSDYLEGIKNQGAVYLILDRNLGEIELQKKLLFSDEHFLIYEL